MDRRVASSTVIWVAVICAISAGVVFAGWRVGCRSVHLLQLTAFVTASLALLWSALAAFCHMLRGFRTDPPVDPTRGSFPIVAGYAALLFGIVPAVIESVILVMRLVYVAIDLIFGAAPFEGLGYGFTSDGLWSLAALFLGCSFGLIVSRDRRLATCLFWLAVAIVLWRCALMPTLRPTGTGGFERTGVTILMVVGCSVVLVVTTIITGWIDRRRRWQFVRTDPDALRRPSNDWPGLRKSFVAMGVWTLLVLAYHLAVPVDTWGWGVRGTALFAACAAALSATSALLMLTRCFSKALADCALGLVSLGLCCLMLAAIPLQPGPLAASYPAIFGAVMVGLGLAGALWCWLCLVWEQQLDARLLESGHSAAWTTAGRLIPHAQRAAFLAVSLALLQGAMLAIWPRLRGIPSSDDSLGAFAGGLGANLFVVLVTLWMSRKLRRMTFHVLTIMALLSVAGFIAVRTLPFSRQIG